MSKDRQDKKAQFAQSQKKRRPLVVIGLAVAAAVVAFFAITGLPGKAGVVTVKPENGVVRIALADVADGNAHFFEYEGQKGLIRFFILKSSDGVFRAAFDSCDVCYREGKGYRQEGDMVVCNNCEQRFPSARINEVKGGCNPAPLQRSMDGQSLVITTADLEAGAWFFAGQNG